MSNDVNEMGCGSVMGFQVPMGIKKRKAKVDEVLAANPDIDEGHALAYFSSLSEDAGEEVGQKLDGEDGQSFLAGAIRDHAIRELVRSKVKEVVRKKAGGGGYVLYSPNKGKKKQAKAVGTFPTKLGAKKAELARFPPREQNKLVRLRKEVDRMLKDPKKRAEKERRASKEKGSKLPKKESVELLRSVISRLVTERLSETKCPACGADGAYWGLNHVECPNEKCKNFVKGKDADQPETKAASDESFALDADDKDVLLAALRSWRQSVKTLPVQGYTGNLADIVAFEKDVKNDNVKFDKKNIVIALDACNDLTRWTNFGGGQLGFPHNLGDKSQILQRVDKLRQKLNKHRKQLKDSVNESLFREEATGSDWDEQIAKLSKQAVTADKKFQSHQKSIEKKTASMLGTALGSIKKAVGRDVKLKDFGIKHDERQGKTYVAFGATIDDVSVEPIYIYVEAGVPKIEVSDTAKAALTKADPGKAKLFRAELVTVQERVLDKMEDLTKAIDSRDRYLTKLQDEVDGFVADLTPLQLSLLKSLLVRKYRKVT
jgi:hypothetical protein